MLHGVIRRFILDLYEKVVSKDLAKNYYYAGFLGFFWFDQYITKQEVLSPDYPLGGLHSVYYQWILQMVCAFIALKRQ